MVRISEIQSILDFPETFPVDFRTIFPRFEVPEFLNGKRTKIKAKDKAINLSAVLTFFLSDLTQKSIHLHNEQNTSRSSGGRACRWCFHGAR